MKPELVARGVRFGEGPTWRPDSGDLIVTSVMDGLLWRVDPGDGSAEVFADTAGGPNGSTPCSDGGVLVTQNGGMDFGELGLIPPDQAPRPRYTTPCLQRVGADGAVRELCGIDAGLQAPNDLVIDAENNVIFTDPPHYPPAEGSKGRLLRYRSEDLAPSGAQALDPAGRLEVLAVVDDYINGVGISPEGRVLIVEGRGLRWIDPDAGRTWLIEDSGGGDGFAFDREGRVYLCVPGTGLRVVDPDGRLVEDLELPEGAFLTNCCFGGDDLRTLFAMDALGNNVLAWDGMPTPGLPIRTYQA